MVSRLLPLPFADQLLENRTEKTDTADLTEDMHRKLVFGRFYSGFHVLKVQ